MGSLRRRRVRNGRTIQSAGSSGSGPGGANDLIARFAAEGVSKRLGQPIVIENRPGAGAVIATAFVAHSAPDGYTFLVGAASTITNSLMLKDLPYADSDLVPVGMIAVAPSTIIVHPSVPANNMAEFIAWAKAQGDKGVNWATAGNGSTPEFVAEMIKEATGVSFTIVPYKSGGDGVNAVLANNVSATSEASIVVLPKIQAGLLKAIATTYEKAHQRLSVDHDHGGAGLPDRPDRPLGGPLCAARHAGADHSTYECRAAGSA